MFSVIGSRDPPQDTEHLRDVAERSWERDHDPRGPARQLAAVLAYGDRTRELRRITAPTLVVHGTKDPMIRPSGARATLRAIPGARLLEIDGMGHDLPRAAWPRMIEAIVANAARAEPALQAA